MITRTKFWLVWNPTGRSPYFQHGDKDSATKEAERLAGLNPGHLFYVVQAISVSHKRDVETIILEDGLF